MLKLSSNYSAFVPDLLVLLDLGRTSEYEMSVSDIGKRRLLNGIIVNLRVINEELFALFELGIRNRNRAHKRLGIGMQRIVEELLRLRDLHDPALIDNDDAVADEADDGKIVRYEEIRQAPLLLEPLEQVEHLRANGNVKSGDRLVSDNKLGLHDDGARKADTLALTAGELMRIPCEMLRKETDLLGDLLDLGHPVLLVLIKMEVIETLGDDVLDRGALVKGGGGILEYHLDLPDDFAVVLPRELAGDALALVEYLSRGAGIDPDYRTSYGGFAGAGLSDEGKGLALIDVEAYVIDRLKGFLAPAEDNIEILY